MAFAEFFKDKKGRVVITQSPNVPIITWVAASAANFIISNSQVSSILSVVGTVALFIWAGLELMSGDSPFRKLLGLVVLTYILTRLFI